MLQVHSDEDGADSKVDVDEPAMTSSQVIGAQLDKTGGAGEPHLRQVIALLRRRFRLILAISGVGTVLATVVGLLIPPKYTAMAQLVVELPPNATSEVTGGVSLMDESIDTHVTLVSSREHLRRVLESLSQEPRATTRVSTEPGTPAAASGAANSVAANGSATSMASEPGVVEQISRNLMIWVGELRRMRRARGLSLEQVERNTKVLQERRSRVISIAFTSTSPEKAAAFANRIGQLYVDDLLSQKRAASASEMARLEEHIAKTKSEMERSRFTVQAAIQQGKDDDRSVGTDDASADRQVRELALRARTSAQLYIHLLQRLKDMRDNQENIVPDVELHSSASVPGRPSSHNPLFFIIPAFFIFVIGASWLAIVLERMDRTIRSPRDVSDALGLPCITLVPRLARKQRTRPKRYLLDEPFSAYAEAIRSVAASLRVATPGSGHEVVLISSSVPGEGKTTLAASLAVFVGLLGRRVLLIDLGFRRASMICGLSTIGGALLDPNEQSQALGQFVQQIPDLGIDYLRIGRSQTDPLALLSREQIPHLISQSRGGYDCVIIDGPPLLGATESRLLASMVDRLLFVVKWGSTRRGLADSALHLVRDVGCLDKRLRDRPIAILTQVSLKAHAQYRFGDIGECLVKYRKHYLHSVRT
jgi:polysaccharide biosynthesis transport protein